MSDKMIKLKKILIEFDIKNRSAFVIDDNGVIHSDITYHGDIFKKKGFETLLDKAMDVVGYNRRELDRMIEAGSSDLLHILDDEGFLRGGVWLPSRRELYFDIHPNKLSDGAKMGAIKKIAEYKPTQIFVEDIKSGEFGYMEVDEFAGEYL